MIELIYPRYAQVGGEPIEPEYEMEEEEGEGPSGHEPEIEATDAQTEAFVAQIQQIGEICEASPDEYQIGCYAAMYRELAADIPANGDYAEVKETAYFIPACLVVAAFLVVNIFVMKALVNIKV